MRKRCFQLYLAVIFLVVLRTAAGKQKMDSSLVHRRSLGTRRALGQPCTRTTDCYDRNAECNSDRLCSCKDGYIDNAPNVIGGQCQANLGSSCQKSSDCNDYFAECVQSTCRCKVGKIFSRGRCLNVCGKIDIRNRVSDLKRLENCTVIEGHLHIVLIDYASADDYEDYSFPDLVEISDYLMLYRVRGLKSLAKLFPNLAVIRGQNLQIGCALIVYEMPDMVDLGLVNLTAMPRGMIRIEKNSKLCYIETVDWQRIATGVSMEDHVFKYNRDIKECVNRCPENCQKTMGLKDLTPRCWSLEHCQKNLGCECGPGRFCDENTKKCCDSNCIGGCYGTKATECIACQKVVDYSDPNKPRCAARCSAGYFEFKNRRCLSMGECLNFTFYRGERNKQPMLKLVIPETRRIPGECVYECGEGFRDDPTNTSKCIPCRGKCPKVCSPLYIDRVETAQNLKGCTQILGNLEIGIPHGSQIGKELDENLASIEEVTGAIRIHRSNPLLSLHFFKNLKTIGGGNLFQDRYSLVVIDNLNLQELFLEDVAKNLKLNNGTVLFQYNRKLCYNKIRTFVDQIGHTDKVDQNDISPDTNGDQMPCEVKELDVTIVEVSPRIAILLWTTFKTRDPRHIISYAINYKEAPTKNVSIYANRDACSDDGWKVQDIQPKKDDKGTHMNELIVGLEPWTQYALYIETLTISRAKEGAISKVVYFRTAADVPMSPTDLVIRAEHPHELHVTWGPPTKPNGNITHYEVYWQRRNLDPKEYELRDYCTNPLSSSISIEETEEEKEKKEEEMKNEDGQTCQCKKSQKELEKEKNEREMEIFFQNALQNEVFMKSREDFWLDKPATTLSPEMMDRTREIRSVQSDDVPDGHEKQKYTYIPDDSKPVQPGPGVDKVKPKDASLDDPLNNVEEGVNATKKNMTKLMKELMQKENPYYKAVVFETLELIIPNLGYFEDYNVEVIACQERDPRNPNKAVLCSNKALGVARTQPDSNADTINSSTIEVHHPKNKTGAIYIKWRDPPKPNGLILSYDIEYVKANIANVKPIEFCVTYKKYRDIGKGGHEVDNLEPGNYTFRIRANSLAGNGSWSEYFTFTIPDPEDKGVKTEVYVAAIVSGLIVIILITIGVVWFVAKKRFEKEAHTIFSTNPEYPLLVYEPDEWEVEREKVELLKELGQGSFGMVYEGIVRDVVSGVESIRVAVKTINRDSSDHERYMFLQEASIMKMFKCHHVVRLIGVVSKGQPALVLMELMPFGDLKNFLRQHRPDEDDNNGKSLPTLRQIMQIAGEIADGMAYLADKKFVHRDLAARNCMVGEDMTVKIGDFGMTRDIYETDYYRKGNRGLLPVRWMAPESLKDGVFTSMSDVWSYGVVLWEMATLAAQPYQGLSNEEVLRYVISGKVMDTPERCPPKLYDLMVKCWRYRPKQRPTFKEIIEILLPDLDKKFKDLSYFFSEENAKYEEAKLHSASNNYQPTEDEIEDIDDDDDDNHCPMNDYVDEANLPMLGVGASNGHSVELQDIFTDTGSYPHYNSPHRHVGSAESCDCPTYRDTDEGAAAPPIDFNRQSVCSSPNSAIGGSSDGSKDSSKSSNSSYQRINGLSVANGHVPVPLRTTPC